MSTPMDSPRLTSTQTTSRNAQSTLQRGRTNPSPSSGIPLQTLGSSPHSNTEAGMPDWVPPQLTQTQHTGKTSTYDSESLQGRQTLNEVQQTETGISGGDTRAENGRSGSEENPGCLRRTFTNWDEMHIVKKAAVVTLAGVVVSTVAVGGYLASQEQSDEPPHPPLASG